MAANYFLSITGNYFQCVHPEGKDFLLTAWRNGVRETHPNWFNQEFWMEVERLRLLDEAQAKRSYEKKKARLAEQRDS